MSKYRIHIENIGAGADWDGSTIGCDGFAILGDKGERFEETQHGLSTVELAKMIACSEELRAAARIGLAMYEAAMEEKRAANPLASIFSSIRPVREEDD